MADNVPITAGSGTSIASDDVSGVQYQRMKIADGTPDSADYIPGDSTNGLDVDPSRVAAEPAPTTGNITAGDTGTSTVVNGANQFVVTGTPTANSFVTCALRGHCTVLVQASGTASVTIGFERSMDGGTTYSTVSMERVGIWDATTAQIMSDNRAYWFRGNVAGYTHMRVRCTGFVSGTSAIRIQPGNQQGALGVRQGVPTNAVNAWPVTPLGTVPAGSAISGNPVQIAGNDGTNVRAFKTDANGVQLQQGDVAHGTTNSGNPVLQGSEAIAHGANPTAVAAGQRAKRYANRHGIAFSIGGHPNIVTLKHTTITTAVTDAAIVTIATGLKIVVTRLTVTLDNASTVFPSVIIGFGVTNTPTTTGVLASHGGVPAGGGFTIGDGSGIIGIGADNEDLRVTTVGNATGNGLQITVSYHTIES